MPLYLTRSRHRAPCILTISTAKVKRAAIPFATLTHKNGDFKGRYPAGNLI